METMRGGGGKNYGAVRIDQWVKEGKDESESVSSTICSTCEVDALLDISAMSLRVPIVYHPKCDIGEGQDACALGHLRIVVVDQYSTLSRAPAAPLFDFVVPKIEEQPLLPLAAERCKQLIYQNNIFQTEIEN